MNQLINLKVLILASALALAACSHGSSNYSPSPLPPAAPGWSKVGGSNSTQYCDNFDFTSNPQSYCYNGSIKPRLGQTIRMTFTITGDVTQLIADGDNPPATLHLFLWRNGDNMTCIGQMQQYRWWSARTELKAGTHTVTARVTPENWTDCYGQSGSANPALFEAAVNNLRGAGFTLGGRDFAGHGLRTTGPVHFTVNSFTVESTLMGTKRRSRAPL